MMQQSGKRDGLCAGLLVAGLLAIVSLAGCGGSGVTPAPDVGPLAPVSGIVTMDGEPVAGATVFFRPAVAKQFNGALGATDASGKYELKSDVGNGEFKPGAPLGKYQVTVSKFVKADGTSLPAGKLLTDPKEMLGAHESIPVEYSATSELLTFEVTSAGGKFDIPMKSK
jgi:hypothetical protein